MSDLSGFNRRKPRQSTRVNATEPPPEATAKQLEFIDRLRIERSIEPLDPDAKLTRREAHEEIEALKLIPANTVAPEPPDPDRCPPGWDTDVWGLVLRFDQYARIDRIRLRAGRPVIYSVIADLVSSHGMRDRAKAGGYRHVAEHCERRDLPADLAARCWYHYPPHNPGEQVESTLTWVQMAEIIMAEFWSRVQDDHALDYFRQYFAEYGQAALQHWRSLGILVALGAQPKRPRDMRVPGPRASMPDADTDDPGMSLWMRMRAAKGWPTAAEAAAGAAKAVETLRRANESGS